MTFLGHAVRDYRLQLLVDLMDRDGYDALAFTSSHFAQFVSNFEVDGETWERPILFVVPRHGDAFAFLNEGSTHRWRFGHESGRLWMSDVQFYSEHVQLQRRLPIQGQWSEMAADKLRKVGLHRSRIGFDDLTAPLARTAQLLPQAHFQDASTECSQLLLVKHPDEIDVMRQAASLSDWVQERYRENIRPGRLLQELDMSMFALAAEEAARRLPGENVGWWVQTLSGPASCAPHGNGTPTGARIEQGDGIVNVICMMVNGLWIENERTWFCGKPSARQTALYEATLAANEAGCAAATTGNQVCAIDAAAQQQFERAGVADLILHRTGHGLGIMDHEYPIDMPFNTQKLRADQVVSVEPGVYEWGLGGFRIDDTVVVGDVPEVLTTSPKDLASQIIT